VGLVSTAAERVRERLLVAECKEKIRQIEKQLELYRLASPERLWRLERLTELQRELIQRLWVEL
jgi:predicted DNA-binding transcriptional regulator